MIGGGSMAVNEKITKKENKGFELETYFEFNGIQINSDELIKRAREAYLAEGNSLDDVKSVKIYINANERRAYYVVNDQAESKFIEF
jgi:hypothetical protein